ncbi:hypothetical protein Vretimale_2192, partial [Volvox reticuliferus]
LLLWKKGDEKSGITRLMPFRLSKTMMRHSPARNVASKGCSVLAQVPENEARDFGFTNINISTSITRARQALRHRLPRRPRNMSAASGSDASSNRSLNSAAGRQLLHALEEAQAQTIAQQAQTITQQVQTITQQVQTITQQAQTIAQQAQIIAQQQAQINAQLQRDIEALQAAQQAPRHRGLLRLFSCC